MTTTETASVIHENTITTTEIPSVVADGAGEAAPTALSTGLVIQLLSEQPPSPAPLRPCAPAPLGYLRMFAQRGTSH